jgi:hypothetical protein
MKSLIFTKMLNLKKVMININNIKKKIKKKNQYVWINIFRKIIIVKNKSDEDEKEVPLEGIEVALKDLRNPKI